MEVTNICAENFPHILGYNYSTYCHILMQLCQMLCVNFSLPNIAKTNVSITMISGLTCQIPRRFRVVPLLRWSAAVKPEMPSVKKLILNSAEESEWADPRRNFRCYCCCCCCGCSHGFRSFSLVSFFAVLILTKLSGLK